MSAIIGQLATLGEEGEREHASEGHLLALQIDLTLTVLAPDARWREHNHTASAAGPLL